MYLVYGLQRSGISVIELLENKKIQYRIWDDNNKVRYKLRKKFDKKFFYNPKFNDLNKFEKIIISPGISLKNNKLRANGILPKLERDLNLYISNLTNQKLIAITGTNGKSTTTKLIGDILKKKKITTFVGGNIGEPLCNALIKNKKFKFHVIELSSFQLERVNLVNSNISIITNLSNDHLDRYKNITEYIKQKKNIITKKGLNIISIDDKYSKKIFLQKKIKNKISFSISDQTADVYMNNNYILDNYFKKNKKLIIKYISKDLEGLFNNQNILIAYICCKFLKIPEKYFIEVIKNFKGLPFRSEIIFENKNLKVINNSKATNINSTINSVKNYENIYLILGGIAKEKNFEILSKYKKNIICTYLFGKSSSMIEKKIQNFTNVKKFKNLKSLIKQIFKDVKKQPIKSHILFAPACTSYDQYKNFEERGKDFSSLIKQNIINL